MGWLASSSSSSQSRIHGGIHTVILKWRNNTIVLSIKRIHKGKSETVFRVKSRDVSVKWWRF